MVEIWNEVQISEIAEKLSMGPFGSSIKSDNFVDSGVPIIRGGNLTAGRFFAENFVFLTEEKADELKASNAFAGDIVFTHRGTLGQVGIIPRSKYPRYVISQSQMKMTCDKEKADVYFIYYYFKSPEGQQKLLCNVSQTGVPAIAQPLSSLKKIKLFLPSLVEQKAIAEILACLDDKIELNNRMNKTLEEMAQAIFKSWFVDFEPFQDGEFVDSELGRIPKGWRVGTLGDICSYTRERISVDSLSLSTYISTENMLPNKAGYINASGLPSVSQTTKFSAGDILISNIRPYFKKIVFCSHDGGCSADVLCLKSTRFQFASFTYFVVFSDRFFDFMMLGSKGTKMPRGDKSQIMKYKIIIPSDIAQKTFCKIVDPIIQIINQNKFENNNLSSLRDTLLPKLMSGEIRVPIQEE